MPDITLPTVTNGDVIDAAELNGLFYTDTNYTSSLRVVNGGLDVANFSSGFLLNRRHTQRGSLAQQFRVSGTSNLDYRYYWFPGMALVANDWEGGLDALGPAVPHQPIPGGSLSRHARWDGVALLNWQIFWGGHEFSADPLSAIFLKHNGAYVPGQFRPAGYIGDNQYDPKGYRRLRVWSGNAHVNIERGWQDFSLCITADESIRDSRIHACGMRAVFLRQ